MFWNILEDEEDESEGVDPTSDGDPNTNTSETQNVTSTEEGITRQGDGTAAADANKAAEEGENWLLHLKFNFLKTYFQIGLFS